MVNDIILGLALYNQTVAITDELHTYVCAKTNFQQKCSLSLLYISANLRVRKLFCSSIAFVYIKLFFCFIGKKNILKKSTAHCEKDFTKKK